MFSSILVFLIVLSVLILVHEAGHFFMAKRANVLVEEFGFGLPPKLISKKIGETEYSLNLLPFGGFVRLHGENVEEGITNPRRAFLRKNKRTRAKIILAGVVMNLVLAVVAFAIVYSVSGIPRETEVVKIVEVATGSPAEIRGFRIGDTIEKVGKSEVTSVSGFIEEVDKAEGGRVLIDITRGEETKRISVTPRENPPEGEGPLGVAISATEVYFPPVWQRPFVGIFYGFKEAVFWGGQIIIGFVDIFRGLVGGRVPEGIAGPVGIFAITSEVATIGTLAVVNFIGILSVNLAILNAIPFPALDGGRLLFIGLEGVIGKKILPKVESTIHTIGMILLLTALLAITIHDVRRIVSVGGISGFISSFGK